MPSARDDHDVGTAPDCAELLDELCHIGSALQHVRLVLDLRGNGHQVVAAAELEPVTGKVDKPHVGHARADGLPDFVVRTGETAQVLFMKGLKVERRRLVRAADGSLIKIGRSWSITRANDFDRDGDGDVILHAASSGETRQWSMRAEAVVRTLTVDARLDAGGARVGLPWRQIKQ
ncbi:MAG TPA: VCBS repeat-containing protein [Burkholderiaceae bacterium]|nr:VCBS repeat-containing protein [Burkholderiaceae bacterium]